MTLPRNAPSDQTNIENLHQLHLYKLHNTPVGEARQSLDDYVDADVLVGLKTWEEYWSRGD